MLHASAYWATIRRVLASPEPPIMIHGRGLLAGIELTSVSFQLIVAPAIGTVVVTPHLETDLDRFLKALEAFGDGWNGTPSPRCKRSFHAAPMPN